LKPDLRDESLATILLRHVMANGPWPVFHLDRWYLYEHDTVRGTRYCINTNKNVIALISTKTSV